jgi:hypothetical protein
VHVIEVNVIDRASFAVGQDDGLTDQLFLGSMQFPEDVVPIATLDGLRTEARRRGIRADDLAEVILQNVVTDDLFPAVIDR